MFEHLSSSENISYIAQIILNISYIVQIIYILFFFLFEIEIALDIYNSKFN